MPTTYEALMRLREENVRYRYEERDTLLYAVSIGMGRDPLNEKELHYVYENYPLRVVPTQAVVVARQKLIWDVGLDVGQFLHGEQRLTLHRPLPRAATLLADAWISEVYDKGPGKGCVIQLDGVVRDADGGLPLFDWMSLIVARGDGGVGGPSGKVPAPHPMPTRKPDLVATAETRRDQPLLYRLNGDRNLVHVDPKVARDAGFHTPILHGACTYAVAAREVLAHVCDYDHTRVHSCDVRFSAPVFPGEHVETQIWVDGEAVSFRARSVERDVIVLDHGHCGLKPSTLTAASPT
ncbi:MaoC family dehydratase [Rhodopila sp.]|uniref:MaoC family dehydratase n=1 Tax=Rhodopila sp. TaxID=2480087 RepID=UPI002C96D2B9|nr:MaoC/PaaZ C-terminal domain-containing protein [Rhodopila sp.]HVZ06720.1 MaoC/PaaZ C-terminal domain-containing protein [Rhodopila sp.]